MKLVKLKLRNFRGYKNEAIINIDSITALIGKNDAGKSTILEALEIFFNNKVVVCEKEDLSINADDNSIYISCIFNSLPDNVTIDASSVTDLGSENLLNVLLRNLNQLLRLFVIIQEMKGIVTYCNLNKQI